MTAMATRFFPRMALAAIGPGPGWWRPPKTRSEKLGTFQSYLTLLHFSETLDRENHAKVLIRKALNGLTSPTSVGVTCERVRRFVIRIDLMRRYAPNHHALCPHYQAPGSIEKYDTHGIRPYALCVLADFCATAY